MAERVARVNLRRFCFLLALLFPAGVGADPITILATVATTAAGTAFSSGVAAIFTAAFVKTVISSVVITTLFSVFTPKPSQPKNLGLSPGASLSAAFQPNPPGD